MDFVNAMSSYDAMDVFAADQKNVKKETVKEIFSQLVQDKKEECIERIQNGSLEPSFQIGSGSYTETEWKKLLEGFDAVQAKLREETEENTKEAQKTDTSKTADEEDKDIVEEKCVEMLLSEITTATYPSGEKDVPDDIYETFYTPEGIYCRKRGEADYEWKIPFEDESQYEKVMTYLKSLDSQENLRFACRENFWQDFLNDQIDMEQFQNFLDTRVKNGVPNYLDIYETGTKINEEAAQYSKYMNHPDFGKGMCYTSEEAFATLLKNGPLREMRQPDHEVIRMDHLEEYYANHTNETGRKNHYYNGRWYSMAELLGIWNSELEELFE